MQDLRYVIKALKWCLDESLSDRDQDFHVIGRNIRREQNERHV